MGQMTHSTIFYTGFNRPEASETGVSKGFYLTTASAKISSWFRLGADWVSPPACHPGFGRGLE
jgi:hypothetical protein